MSAQHTPGLEALDFVVLNVRTGNPIAAFMLPRDALHFIEFRRNQEGPHGPLYDLKNADGSPTSPQLDEAARRANTGAAA